MSRTILSNILSMMLVRLSESETEDLYRELLAHFNLIGASDQCEALDSAWRDAYNREQIEEFIKAWLRKKRSEKPKPITGLV